MDRSEHPTQLHAAPAEEPGYSRWWLALTILLGQVTLAFSMFAVVVALPKIMSAMSADVTSIHWVRSESAGAQRPAPRQTIARRVRYAGG